MAAQARKTGSRRTAAEQDAIGEFLDVAGHELRGPITSLKGHAQLFRRRLAKQAGRDADVVELSKMLYQIERLEHDLDVYLEAARLQQKRVHLVPQMCDLIEIARKQVDLYAAGAGGGAIRLETSLDSLWGLWDKRRVRLTIGVLLANAVKFGADSEVIVRIGRTDDSAHVEVLDRGLGVPAKERRAIFRAYATGSNADNSGVGLGLYVARELVRKHRGSMGVRARDGGGSAFWLAVPLVGAEPDDAGRSDVASEQVHDDAPLNGNRRRAPANARGR